MAEFKKFDPYAVLRTGAGAVSNPPKAPKVSPTLGALAALASRLAQDGGRASVGSSHDLWSETEEERAAIVENDGKIPRAWADAFARVDQAAPPPGTSPARWLRFVNDCGLFLDNGWADLACRLGWQPIDLFGCDRRRAFGQPDAAGLLWRLDGGKLVLLSAHTAVVEDANAQRRYIRLPVRSGVVLSWRLFREKT